MKHRTKFPLVPSLAVPSLHSGNCLKQLLPDTGPPHKRELNFSIKRFLIWRDRCSCSVRLHFNDPCNASSKRDKFEWGLRPLSVCLLFGVRGVSFYPVVVFPSTFLSQSTGGQMTCKQNKITMILTSPVEVRQVSST